MPTILSIDDDPWVVETLKIALADKGYEVIAAPSAAEAEQELSRRKIDLVLLDLGLPDKSGFALYRDCAALKRLPVLFVSGCSRSFDADSEEFVALWTNEFLQGTTDILYKPFNLDTLYEKVEALIGDQEVTEREPAA